MDPKTKDELQMVEVEGQDTEGQKIKAALVSLKPSTLPSVSKSESVCFLMHKCSNGDYFAPSLTCILQLLIKVSKSNHINEY